MNSIAIAFMLTGLLHHNCVVMDESVRYQQLADIQANRIVEVYSEPEYYEEVYYEPVYQAPYDTSDGISAAEFQWMGVVEDDEHFYTWYSERILPGGGLTELNENGRHSEDGFVKDGDGYIAVASCDYDVGTVIDTPFGPAKVYDTGYLQPGQVDVYTSF